MSTAGSSSSPSVSAAASQCCVGSNSRAPPCALVESAKSISEGGFIYSFRVADDSGSIIANFWNAIGDCIRVGDIILVTGGYGPPVRAALPSFRANGRPLRRMLSFVTMFKSSMRLACKVGTVVRLGTFAESYSDAVDHSASRWLPNPEKANEMVSGGRGAPPRRLHDVHISPVRRSGRRTRCLAEGAACKWQEAVHEQSSMRLLMDKAPPCCIKV